MGQEVDTAKRMAAHYMAARRLTDGLRAHPDARGLAKSLAFHVRQVSILSMMLAGTACEAVPHQ